MSMPQPHRSGDRARSVSFTPVGSTLGRTTIAIDWNSWLRTIERKRRSLHYTGSRGYPVPLSSYYWSATLGSFLLDGITLSEAQVREAVRPKPSGKAVRSRLRQRIRNHIGILKQIERDLRFVRPLKTEAVVRWYTSISCGLSTAMLSLERYTRLEQVVAQTNSPHLRSQQAVIEIARLHANILRDDLVPSFNGILARLILRYHLGRCGFPPVVFDATCVSNAQMRDENQLLPLLMERIEQGFDLLMLM